MNNTIITVVLSAIVSFVVSIGTWGFLDQGNPGTKISPTPQVAQQAVVPSIAASDDIVEVIDRVDDSVVSVIITKDIPVMNRNFGGSLFDQFFFGDPRFLPQEETRLETERREIGGGTAFFVSDDGLLLTNKHVVNDTDADYSVRRCTKCWLCAFVARFTNCS